MKYYQMFSRDTHGNTWVLSSEDPLPVHMLPRYRDLACPNCGKVPEAAALARGIDPSVRVHSSKDARRDLIAAHDGFILVSVRFRNIAEASGINGIVYHPIPGDPRFFVITPHRVPIDLMHAGYEFHPPEGEPPYGLPAKRLATPDHRCIVCGRYYELCLSPLLESMELPADPLTVFSPQAAFEKQYGEMLQLFCSAAVREIFQREKLKGIEFVEA